MQLNRHRFEDAIRYLGDYEGLVVPHNERIYGNMFRDPNNITEADWNAFRWNPLQGGRNTEVDPNASPKPAYADLLWAAAAKQVAGYQEGFLTFKVLVRVAIAKWVYGADSVDHEFHIKDRLVGTEILRKMNHNRDHVRQRYHEIKHFVNSIPRNEDGERKVRAIWESGISLGTSLSIKGRIDTLENYVGLRDLLMGVRWTIPGTKELYADHDDMPEYVHHDPGHAPFGIELTLETPITNDDSRQVAALHIFGSAKADYNLTYPTSLSVHLDKDLTGSPITQLSSARPRAGVTTVWIARRAGASTERELAAEISVFASPYGELKGAKTTVTFPAVPVAPPGG